jgi:hypothetical protein
VTRQHVLVLDDNSVWGDSPNVLRVVPFIFFNVRRTKKKKKKKLVFLKLSTKVRLPAEQPGEWFADSDPEPPAIPLSMLYMQEAVRDVHLNDLMRVLTAVHEQFFTDPSQHVAALFARVRSEVFFVLFVILFFCFERKRFSRFVLKNSFCQT